MSYQVRMVVHIDWCGDGMGPMTPLPAQTLELRNTPPFNAQPVAAATMDAPTSTEFETAITAAATAINAQIPAVTARLQGFATGNG